MAIKVKETAIPKAFMAVIASLPVREISDQRSPPEAAHHARS
jgi:hypothetical protein